ncbi:MAG: right-handed parallel beta-helix repeat-containing protein [Alphaproteobacteria bacterium]|nr:right-handed parallel beta-helix repeat-containing protein [Alphaproteobacteria bacterium]
MSTSNTSKRKADLANIVGKHLMNTTAMTAAGLLAFGGSAQAANDWTGHILDSGSTTVDTSVLNETNITQHTNTVRARGDADIKLGHTVNLAQPSTSSRYILFDTEADPTHIHGSLNANGEVFVFDRDGVIFGTNSQINVGSLVASSGTLTSTDAELDAGKIKIDLVDTDGQVTNRGSITVAQGGLAAFVAPNVLNSGVIQAKMGSVVMAGGKKVTLDLYGDGLVEVAVEGELADGLLENTGQIQANGGNVLVSAAVAKDAVEDVINMSGVTTVSSAVVKGGKIILSGGGKGKVSVSGVADASGATGGGEVKVRGETIEVSEDAIVLADADNEGDGGDIIFYADDKAIYRGDFYARGGAAFGNGGFVELSAVNKVGYDGSVNTSAVNGQAGNFLLDPLFAIIHSGSIHTPLGFDYILSAGALADDIHRNGSVTVQADNFIDVGTDIDLTIPFVGSIGNGDIDVSQYDYTVLNKHGTWKWWKWTYDHYSGITAGDLTLESDTVNFNKNLTLGTGNLNVLANTVNLDGTLSDTSGLLDQADIFTTAAQVNVLSDAAKIQQGIYLATAGGNVNVGAGLFAESVNVDKTINLFGANAGLHGNDEGRGEETIVQPNSPGFLVTADDVTIDGFEIDGSSTSGDNGITVGGVNNFTAINNKIHDNTDTNAGRQASNWTTGVGVFVNSSTGKITIADNDLYDNTDGVRILDSSASSLGKIKIKGNDVRDNGDKGIIAKLSDNIQISGNTVEGNATGVWLETSSNSLVNNNDVNDSTQNGIRLRNGSDSVELRNNRINGAGDNGILVAQNSDDVKILNNKINNVDEDAIHLEESANARIEDNKIGLLGDDDNIGDDGIKLVDSDDALIQNNKISNVTEDGIDLDTSDRAKILDNVINNTGDDAIDLDESHEALIRDNRIGLLGGADNIGDDGIDLDGSDDAKIKDNKIQNTVENGIDNRDSHGTTIIGNILKFIGLNGIYVNPSDDIRIVGNTITDVDEDGIRVNKGSDVRVRDNTIRRVGKDGIDITRNDRVRVTGNTVTDTGRRGISVERSFGKGEKEFSVVVADNTVKDTGRTSIVVDRFTTARVVDNTVRDSNRAGIRLQRGDYARIRRNDVHDTKREGIKALGIDEVEIRRNEIRNTRWDGVLVDDFTFAWIGLNDVRNTGDDAIQASNGEYVAVYDNLIRKAGFFEGGKHADIFGADAIFVTEVGNDVSPDAAAATLDAIHSSFGFNVEVVGNDISKTYDDGAEIVNAGPTWVSDNIITNVGYGPEGSYGGGDFYGADAVHLRNVSGLPHGLRLLKEALIGDDSYVRRTLNGTLLREAEVKEATLDANVFPKGAPWDYSSVVINNQIKKVADDGVEVVGGEEATVTLDIAGPSEESPHMAYPEMKSSRTLIAWNDIRHIGYGYTPDGRGADAVHVRGINTGFDPRDVKEPRGRKVSSSGSFAVEILENFIKNTMDDGAEVLDSGRTRIVANEILDAGFVGEKGSHDADAIHVRNVRQTSKRRGRSDVRIVKNIVGNAADDGIEVLDTNRVVVKKNLVDLTGDDGIRVVRFFDFGPSAFVPEGRVSLVSEGRDNSKAVISENVVTNAGTPFPEETSEDTLVVASRSIRRPGGDGIEVSGFNKAIVENNDVSNSVENGLNVSGPNNGDVIVSGNTFTDNDVGANFESGTIDLTGVGNTFNGGRVGMRFAPAEMIGYDNFLQAAPFSAVPVEPTFADMELVGNTIGAQMFNGQGEFYVELDNEAFFAPGSPTLLNALDSTYVGTPFGTFTPSVDYAGGFPLDVVAFLESKFFHFNDNGNTGLFFFPLLPNIAQEDIFNYFGPNAGALSGLNVTILGLPGIPGGAPVALNNIAPAAGGTDPASLNAIATAAGGDSEGSSASCWGDALDAAGSGPSTISYGGSAEDLLNSEASCGS